MTYPWRRQEQCYQPWRLKVVERRAYNRYYNIRVWGYSIAKFNTATREILYLNEADQFVESGDVRVISLKEIAIGKAKRIAIEHKLPFIISKDHGTYEDFHRGPILECLVCGQRWKKRGEWARGWEPDVCPSCRRAVLAYKDEHKELIKARILQNEMAHPGNYWSYKDSYEHALRAMVGIAAPHAGIERGEAYRRADIGETHGHRSPAWIAPMRPWQLEALKEALGLVNATIKTAYQEGLHAGSNLLEKLRTGEMHPNDFSDLRER
jgi:hypothetical protein